MKHRLTFQLTSWVRLLVLSLMLGFGLLGGTALASSKAHRATTLTVSDCSRAARPST